MSNQTTIQASEETLVLQLQDKSTFALKMLYQNYSAALLGIIYRIVNDEHLSEDILQESFVKIWNNVSSYDASKGRLFTWMVNICRNTAIDKMRGKDFKKQKKTTSDEAIVHTENIYQAIKPETIGIKDLVDKLKPEWKHIVDLIYFNGFTHQEVSEELNIPLGTVKTRLRNAILHLRQVI